MFASDATTVPARDSSCDPRDIPLVGTTARSAVETAGLAVPARFTCESACGPFRVSETGAVSLLKWFSYMTAMAPPRPRGNRWPAIFVHFGPLK